MNSSLGQSFKRWRVVSLKCVLLLHIPYIKSLWLVTYMYGLFHFSLSEFHSSIPSTPTLPSLHQVTSPTCPAPAQCLFMLPFGSLTLISLVNQSVSLIATFSFRWFWILSFSPAAAISFSFTNYQQFQTWLALQIIEWKHMFIPNYLL